MIREKLVFGLNRFLRRIGLKKTMSAEEAYECICRYLGRRRPLSFLYEFDKVYGVRLRPGDYLCVVKDTGEVMWGGELPEDLYPYDGGKMRLIRKR